MTHARHIRRRSAVLALAGAGRSARAAALDGRGEGGSATAPGTAGARSSRVENGAPEVTFITYVAEDGTPRSGSSPSSDATSRHCVERGNGTHHLRAAAGGDVRRRLVPRSASCPSWEEATSALGYDLPDTGECMVCATGGAPIWGDMEVTPALGVSGTMPVIDASDAGIRLSVESTGVTARGPPRRRPRRSADPIDDLPLARPGRSRPRRWPARWSAWRATASSPSPTHFDWLSYLDRQLAAVVQVRRRGRAGSAPGRRGRADPQTAHRDRPPVRARRRRRPALHRLQPEHRRHLRGHHRPRRHRARLQGPVALTARPAPACAGSRRGRGRPPRPAPRSGGCPPQATSAPSPGSSAS